MQSLGQRRETIAFERGTSARSALGVTMESQWSALGSRLASVRFGSSGERREAAQDGAVQAATFRALADTLTRSVTARDRIVWRGSAWDITGAVVVQPPVGAAEVEFTAVAALG